MERKVRVRFAPSPTGPLHIGGVRTALYNYLFAKQHQGDFILRIEDTDQTRFVPGAEEYIIESLEWSGLKFDEGVGIGGNFGPYKQSERNKLGIYKKYVDQLLAQGHAYYAFDTPEELEQMRERLKAEGGSSQQYDASTRNSMKNSITLSQDEVKSRIESGMPYVVRVKIPRNEQIIFKDLIRGMITVDSSTLDDKVLYKSDGMPTYHMANVVDDYLMQISHVIRGEEWLPSGPLHLMLYRFLGWEDVMPQFAHLPLLLKPDGNGKLSKRDGDRLGFPVFPTEWKAPDGEIYNGYRESGYFPESFINMLAFLGWNPGTEQEIFSLDELIKEFKLERVGKAGAKFDPEKTKWFNEQYLRAKSNEELANLLEPIVIHKGLKVDDKKMLTEVCRLMKERVTFLPQILEQGVYFFTAPLSYDEDTVKKKWKEESSKIVTDLIDIFMETPFKAVELENIFKQYVEKNSLGFGVAMIALRLSITGVGGGPQLFEIMEVLGKEESINRLKSGIENINK